MSLPWSAQQLEWLREMGFDVLARRDRPLAQGPAVAAEPAASLQAADTLPPWLRRAARGVDPTPLLAAGLPHDAATRRRFWRALRPLRKASRAT